MSIVATATDTVKRYSQCVIGIEFWLRPWRFKIERFRNKDGLDEARIDIGPLCLHVRWLFDEIDAAPFIIS